MAAYRRAIVAIPICRVHKLCEFQVRMLLGIFLIVCPTTVALSHWTLALAGVIPRHLLCWRLLCHKQRSFVPQSFLRKVRSLPTHYDLVLLLSVYSNPSLRSSSSYLRLLPRLPITSIYPSVKCFRWQFLRKMWPIQLAFLFVLHVGYSFPPLLYVILNFSYDRSKWPSHSQAANTHKFVEVRDMEYRGNMVASTITA